jgi:2-C-methyl-D-erythritol 4-phosphate cytidylyltransferase
MLTAIIVAGGSGRRMGFDKTFAHLGDKPIVVHSVAAFEAATCVDDIIIVGRDERLPELRELIARHGCRKIRQIITGGVHRQDSVSEGLKRIADESEFVAVHDAARPLVTPAQIELVYAAAREHGAASLAAPVADTLKRATADRVVCGSVDRADLYAMQTPQVFSRELLIRAYEAVAAGGLSVTDDVSALENLGEEVVLVPTDGLNFKITFPSDLALAELVHQQRQTGG